jgi:hypothetical protein
VSSLANRYLHALLSRPQGARPRAGYSFRQRYWASLTGMALTPARTPTSAQVPDAVISQERQPLAKRESAVARLVPVVRTALRRATPTLRIIAAFSLAIGLVVALVAGLVWLTSFHGSASTAHVARQENQGDVAIAVFLAILVAFFWRTAIRLTAVVLLLLTAIGIIASIAAVLLHFTGH